MLLGGMVLTLLFIFVFVLKGVFAGSFTGYLLPITYLAVLATLVESLPIKDFEQITITLGSRCAGLLAVLVLFKPVPKIVDNRILDFWIET